MKKLREKLENLQSEIASVFSELRNSKDVFAFQTLEDYEENGSDVYLNYIDNSGNENDCHPLKIDENGILVVKSENGKTLTIGLNDLSADDYKIQLIELMQEKEYKDAREQ